MKKLMKKNQVIITALAIMIAIAGYLNFSSRDVDLTSTDNVLDESYQGAEGNHDDDLVSAPVADTVASTTDELNSDVENIGEAVLTSTDITNNTSYSFMAEAKLNREQVRAKSKEMLLEIINNENIDEASKEAAINQMLELTDNMEREASAEQQLGAKGFTDAIVSINGDTVDVIVNQAELSDVEKAQIEDIVTRKVECDVNQIVITTTNTEN